VVVCLYVRQRLRGLVHRPSEILGGLVRRGDTVADVGSGLGYFTLAMADIVGPEGKVISVDVQEQMLKRSRHRAERRGLVDRIEFHQASHKGMGLSAPVDFVLAFWMVHEVRDRVGFLAEVRSILRPTGHLLIDTRDLGRPQPMEAGWTMISMHFPESN